MKLINFIRHITRIIFAAVLGFIVVKYLHFETFGNILMFMAIYIGISFMLEPLFLYWEKKHYKKNINGK